MTRIRSNQDHVPVGPFQDWIETNCATYGADKVSEMFGWGVGEAGVRRLFRYRHARCETSRGPRGGRTPLILEATTYPRSVVEDALHRVEPDLFYTLYPEFGGERDITLEPDAHCPFCDELVTPIDGLCPWCVCEHGHLFREVGITDDGFACLECAKAERSAKHRLYQARAREKAEEEAA